MYKCLSVLTEGPRGQSPDGFFCFGVITRISSLLTDAPGPDPGEVRALQSPDCPAGRPHSPWRLLQIQRWKSRLIEQLVLSPSLSAPESSLQGSARAVASHSPSSGRAWE